MTDTVAPSSGVGDCREVGVGEAAAVVRVLEADPLVAAPAAEKFALSGIAGGADGRFFTLGGPDRSLLFVGSSVLPLQGDSKDSAALARAVIAFGFGPMSVHGRRERVAELLPTFEAEWGAAREFRSGQLLMVLETTIDPGQVLNGVRAATLREFEQVLAVAAAMYREELRADPFAIGAGIPFRRRVARSVARGRTYIAVDQGKVIFKADVAAISSRVAQLQGIWVDPGFRGSGIGAGGTAAVCALLQKSGLIPSLVVNSSNLPARAAYARVGMVDAVDYATILM